MLTVPFLLHHMLFLISRINRLYTRDYRTLSGLRQFFTTESPLKMMKNASYFTLIAPFVLKIIKFFS